MGESGVPLRTRQRPSECVYTPGSDRGDRTCGRQANVESRNTRSPSDVSMHVVVVLHDHGSTHSRLAFGAPSLDGRFLSGASRGWARKARSPTWRLTTCTKPGHNVTVVRSTRRAGGSSPACRGGISCTPVESNAQVLLTVAGEFQDCALYKLIVLFGPISSPVLVGLRSRSVSA
jgi:hypothetical protein